MVEFHKITLSDKAWMQNCFKAKKEISCEYTFGNIFGYSASENISVALCNGCMLSKWEYGEIVYYSYPIGGGDEVSALKELVAYIKSENKKARIFAMTKEDAELFRSVFADEFEALPNRDAFDYVYNSEDLINLKGKKYQPKRNHISFFKRNNNWTYEKITKDNIADCLKMNEEWLASGDTEHREDLEEESKIIKLVFENFEELSFVGGLIRIDGKAVAFSMGEALDEETFCVHFEKAFSDIRGAYPMINQQFVENELSSFKYINREDDLGIENLRKAKLSYRPAFLFEKYEAQIV